jgi:hypothetical protein
LLKEITINFPVVFDEDTGFIAIYYLDLLMINPQTSAGVPELLGVTLLATGLFGLFGRTRARHTARRLRLLPEAVNMAVL